jgi:hypothetical protein
MTCRLETSEYGETVKGRAIVHSLTPPDHISIMRCSLEMP